jgi:hypothetical protein
MMEMKERLHSIKDVAGGCENGVKKNNSYV